MCYCMLYNCIYKHFVIYMYIYNTIYMILCIYIYIYIHAILYIYMVSYITDVRIYIYIHTHVTINFDETSHLVRIKVLHFDDWWQVPTPSNASTRVWTLRAAGDFKGPRWVTV